MSEWLIVRALRYQWLPSFVVFVCVFGAAQPLRWKLLERSGTLPTQDVRAFTASERWKAANSARPSQETRPPAILRPGGQSAVTQVAGSGLARLRAQRRALDSKISAMKTLLSTLPAASLAETPTEKAPVHPAVIIVRPPQHVEEFALRNEVAEQRARVEALRAIDTDLHPDLIEAREKLSILQGRLSAAVARDEAAARAQAAQAALVQLAQIAAAAQEQAAVPKAAAEETPSAESLMPELASLIVARADIDRQIREATGSSATTATSVEHVAPLLDSGAYVSAPAPEPRVASNRDLPLPFELASSLVALLVSLLVVTALEHHGDHIAGPLTLKAQLPSAVTFFGAVPKMGR